MLLQQFLNRTINPRQIRLSPIDLLQTPVRQSPQHGMIVRLRDRTISPNPTIGPKIIGHNPLSLRLRLSVSAHQIEMILRQRRHQINARSRIRRSPTAGLM